MIALVPLPPHPRSGRPLPILAVHDGPRLLGHVAEVADFVWWFRLPGSPFFAPAGGPHQRDAVEALLRLKDAPVPPRRGIPSTEKMLAACRRAIAQEGPSDADG